MVNSQSGVSIINHPSKFPWAYDWESFDCTSGETGVEIWNGGEPQSGSISFWKKRLLRGDKSFAFGGTDTHAELNLNVFTSCKMSSLTEANLISALKNGRCIVSNGPEINFEVYVNGSLAGFLGETVTATVFDNITLKASWNSPCGNRNCYPLMNVRVIKGVRNRTSFKMGGSKLHGRDRSLPEKQNILPRRNHLPSQQTRIH
jgi:hypothetical protein